MNLYERSRLKDKRYLNLLSAGPQTLGARLTREEDMQGAPEGAQMSGSDSVAMLEVELMPISTIFFIFFIPDSFLI